MRSDELVAAALLAELLNRDATANDRPGDGDGLHDWNLRAKDGTTIAMEVTRHTDSDQRAFWSGKDDDQYREIAGLGGMYLVDVGPSARRNDLWKQLPKLLPQLPPELIDVDIEDAWWERIDPTPTPEEKQLSALGVKHVSFLTDPDRSAITFTTSGGGALHPDIAVAAAMTEVEPNRAKLRAAVDVQERHLFVWIDGSDFAARGSLTGGEAPPAVAPDLGEGVDVLWIAAVDVSRRPVSASVLWRGKSCGRWSDWTPRLSQAAAPGVEP